MQANTESFSFLHFSRKLRDLLTEAEERRLVALFFSMLVLAASEAMSLAALSGYVALISDPSVSRKWSILSVLGTQNIVWVGGVFAIGIFLVKFALSIGVTWGRATFIRGLRVRLGSELFQRYLDAPWTFHLSTNSSELLRNVNGEVNQFVSSVIGPAIKLSLATTQVVAIVAILLIATDLMGLLPLLPLVIVLWFFLRLTRYRLSAYGRDVQFQRKESIRHIREGFESLPESRVMGIQGFFKQRLLKSLQKFTATQRKFDFISGLTQPIIETSIIITLVGLVAFLIAVGKNTSEVGAILVLMAAASLRLQSAALGISTGISQLRFSQASLDLLVRELETYPAAVQEYSTSQPVGNWDCIEFESVSFRHQGANADCISNLSLSISRGEKLGIIGGSGAGKSTLVCLLMALHKPSSGRIRIGESTVEELGRSWHSTIGYVPQSVYILDGSIFENVTIGIDPQDVDDVRLMKAIEMAQLSSDLSSMPKGLETQVGERGCRLSGGQKQRLGVARALYRDPEVLVLDEVTSGLDPGVEAEFSRALARLPRDLTIVSIAHRYTSLSFCDRVVELSEGRVSREGDWESMCTVTN